MTAPLWGRLSDRVGRRPVLMASMAAAALAYLWMAFATQLWMLFAARAFAGACAGNIAAAQAYIADVTPPEKRAKGMGMIGAAFGLGFIIGPVLGGVIAGDDLGDRRSRDPVPDRGRPVVPRLSRGRAAAAGKPAGSAVAAGGARPPRRGPQRLCRRPGLGRLLLVFFLVILAFAGHGDTRSRWWAIAQFGWGPRPVGFVFFYVGLLLSAAMQGGLIGPLTRRLRRGTVDARRAQH